MLVELLSDRIQASGLVKSGSEIMQRIAVPMIGGMVSSRILTLLVIPALHPVVNGRDITQATG